MTPNIERFINTYTYRTYDVHGRKINAGHVKYSDAVALDLPAGFVERPEWSDGQYRRVWTSEAELSVVTWCEGDVQVSKHATRAEYERELAQATAFYESFI